jgi:hypothetical protein
VARGLKDKYLVDTNIWLERLLDQEKSAEVAYFLEKTPSRNISITDFSLHSIGIILTKLNHLETLRKFVQDLFVEGEVSLIHLEAEDIDRLTEVIQQFKLDFDDAYQYVAAEKYSLTLISFDIDFDRTKAGRKTPREV